MRYIDKTQSPAVENFYPLYVIKQIIASETGRCLEFLDSSSQDEFKALNYKNFSLVRFPEPVGFCLAAAQKIPKHTILFSYGGITLSAENAKKETLHGSAEETAYLLSSEAEQPIVTKVSQDARACGGFGALLPHLPSSEFINELGSSHDKIQKENVNQVLFKTTLTGQQKPEYRIFFISEDEIQPGSIIGYDYGVSYWIERKTSPHFFVAQKTEISTAPISFPRLVFLTPEGNPRFKDDTKSQKFVLLMLSFAAFLEASDFFELKSLTIPFSNKALEVLTMNVISILNEATTCQSAKTLQYNRALLFIPGSKIKEITAPEAQTSLTC